MKEGCLPADSGVIDKTSRVHVSAAVQQKPGSLNALVLRRNVQQGRSAESKHPSARGAAVQFRESAAQQRWIGIELLSQNIHLPAKQRQHWRRAVLGSATGSQKHLNATTECLRIAHVSPN